MPDIEGFDVDVVSASEGAHVRVMVAGEVDLATAHEIRSVVSVIAGWSETKRVTLDLNAVTFMDSSGISALLLCHRDLAVAEIRLDLDGATGTALRVLELSGVLGILSPPLDDSD